MIIKILGRLGCFADEAHRCITIENSKSNLICMLKRGKILQCFY